MPETRRAPAPDDPAGEVVFQLWTDEWRRRALRLLAAQRGISMRKVLEDALDRELAEAGIPLGVGQDAPS